MIEAFSIFLLDMFMTASYASIWSTFFREVTKSDLHASIDEWYYFNYWACLDNMEEEMDALARTRVVTNTTEMFIRAPSGMEKYWVFRNLGPAKITINIYSPGVTGTLSHDLRMGDYFEARCQNADVKIAQGEAYDAAVLQWMPVP